MGRKKEKIKDLEQDLDVTIDALIELQTKSRRIAEDLRTLAALHRTGESSGLADALDLAAEDLDNG